jgi:hypothetical protein
MILATVFQGQMNVLILTNILGNFFTNSSGRPEWQQPSFKKTNFRRQHIFSAQNATHKKTKKNPLELLTAVG